MLVSTIPVYILGVLQGYNQLINGENVTKRNKCTGVSYARKRAWIYIEIIAFVVNSILLCLYLIEQFFRQETGSLLNCCAKAEEKKIG